jgi:hypothetical protein
VAPTESPTALRLWLVAVPIALLVALGMLVPFIWFTPGWFKLLPVGAGLLTAASAVGLGLRPVRWYRRAVWILGHVPPVRGVLTVIPSELGPGQRHRVRVTFPNSAGLPRVIEFLTMDELPTGATHGADVDVHADPIAGGPVVVRADSKTIWAHHLGLLRQE